MTNKLECMDYDFKGFAEKVINNLTGMMKQGNLFKIDISGRDIWDLYIGSFPNGTNPVFRERTYHEGNYDKNFIRRVGNVVSLKDGVLHSVWDIEDAPYPYNIVAEKLSEYVHSSDVNSLFRIKENHAGHVKNMELLPDGGFLSWEHFYTKIPTPHFSLNAAKEIGEYSSNMGVFVRALEELSIDSIDTILDLINENSIYRGQEFKDMVTEFKKVIVDYKKINDPQSRNRFAWSHRPNIFRNTAIGTLAVDLSSGVDLEDAVKSYEKKVAPENYRRPTALITQKMVKDAFNDIEQLGLNDSLERRHAKIDDVGINDVIWVDRSTKSSLKDGSLFTTMMKAAAPKSTDSKNVVDISAEQFFKEVVPAASEMEVYFSGNKKNNLMSVTAPVHEDSQNIFQWKNGFAWSYNGNIADSSISQKVKAAGGNISAPLRVSLAWFNYDDLDIHAQCPDGRIYFGNRNGILDVDMNAGGSVSRSPVENLAWNRPKNGNYKISVNQFRKRETDNIGFVLEVENNGSVHQYSYNLSVSNDKTINCFEFDIVNGIIKNFKVLDKNITGTGISEDIWGLSTENFVKVKTIINSPNHWDGEKTGNKHWFFILENCKNPDEPRGIYNEFLRSDLQKHRKVFEVLGSKTKCPVVDEQLSGLGFSSTKHDDLTVKVTTEDSICTYKVQF